MSIFDDKPIQHGIYDALEQDGNYDPAGQKARWKKWLEITQCSNAKRKLKGRQWLRIAPTNYCQRKFTS